MEISYFDGQTRIFNPLAFDQSGDKQYYGFYRKTRFDPPIHITDLMKW
jgi:hypothetical protein